MFRSFHCHHSSHQLLRTAPVETQCGIDHPTPQSDVVPLTHVSNTSKSCSEHWCYTPFRDSILNWYILLDDTQKAFVSSAYVR
jgi:hypothetical protein